MTLQELKDFDENLVDNDFFELLIKDENIVHILYTGISVISYISGITIRDWYTLYLIDGEEIELHVSRIKTNLCDCLNAMYDYETKLIVYVGDEYAFEGTPADIYNVLTINLMTKLKVENMMIDGSVIIINTEVIEKWLKKNTIKW